MNSFDDYAVLITEIPGEPDEDGFPGEKEPHETEIFAEKTSVTRSEFYSAMRAGVKADLILRTHEDEFQSAYIAKDGREYEPEKAKFGQKTYEIKRTFAKDGYIELTLEES